MAIDEQTQDPKTAVPSPGPDINQQQSGQQSEQQSEEKTLSPTTPTRH